MTKTTWADWWASRTIRFNLYMTALFAALVPVLAGFSEADYATLGLSPKWVMIAMAVVKVIDGVQNINLRLNTARPIAGRSDDASDKGA